MSTELTIQEAREIVADYYSKEGPMKKTANTTAFVHAIKERINSEIDTLLEESKTESAEERMTEKIFAAGMSKALNLITAVQAEYENGND